jgi:hypothetical protein
MIAVAAALHMMDNKEPMPSDLRRYTAVKGLALQHYNTDTHTHYVHLPFVLFLDIILF